MRNPNNEKTILKHLQDFYKDWLIWASEGAPVVEPFDRHSGLCMALQNWVYHKDFGYELLCDMRSYMKDDFRNDGLDPLYPFGEDDWNTRGANNTMHKCPKRFDFVYRMAKRHI